MSRLPPFLMLAMAVVAVDATALAQRTGSCEHRNGPFAWNCAGPIAGMQCTQIVESADPNTWNDNFFCAQTDIGLRWSSSAPVPGMRCTQILESADPHTWNDNWLCVPQDSPYTFRWSSRTPIRGMQCVQWDEPADPHTWNDNYLCWSPPAAPPPAVQPPPPPPPPPPAGGERADHRCGPGFGDARCGAGRCCSVHNWCGSRGEPHCGDQRGFNGRFDGP